MSKWKEVGNWIKDNAGSGTALIGSLLTGNVPGAVAAGVSLVSGATGTTDPSMALAELQNNPDAQLKLKELYYKNEESVRRHIESMERLKLEDEQKAHAETQQTIRAGDKSEHWFIRGTRPAQSWLSLVSAIGYVFYVETPDLTILGLLLTLPWAYAGLRQVGKGIDTIKGVKNV